MPGLPSEVDVAVIGAGAVGIALSGLLILPSLADDQHSSQSRKNMSYQSKLSTYPQRTADLESQPPTEPYRSTFYFPKDPPARPREDQVRDVTLYDTSGPYTDPSVATDVRRGLDSPA